MDAIQFLKQEHQKAQTAFGQIFQAPPQGRGRLWNELEPELKAHEQIENACLYEPLSREASKLAGWRRQHQDEVHEVEGLIKEISELQSEDSRWLSKVKEVQVSLETHIREEEQDIFPRVSKVWDEARLGRAGAQMEEMKSKKMGQAG